MRFSSVSAFMAATLLASTSTALSLPRGAPQAIPNAFNIVAIDIKNPSWKQKLFVPPTSPERPITFPRASGSEYSSFTLNVNKTISVISTPGSDSSASDPLLLYMIGDPAASRFSLAASPFKDPVLTNYTLLTNSASDSKIGKKTQIDLTIGAAAFMKFTSEGLLGYSAQKTTYRTGGGDGPEDDTIERFQFVIVKDGAKVDDIVVS
ncbi:MAG: hypothetical protein M1814_003836 [Vezdaea aestivalis]|nr:MAG: hypothetical protein M1814_003836 [Vezdaea aestivalis]